VLEQSGAPSTANAPPTSFPTSSACAATCTCRARRHVAHLAPRRLCSDRTTANTAAAIDTSPSITWCPLQGWYRHVDNLVTSCALCNRKKADRPPDCRPAPGAQATAPEPAAFVFLHVDHIHESWRPYLSYAVVLRRAPRVTPLKVRARGPVRENGPGFRAAARHLPEQPLRGWTGSLDDQPSTSACAPRGAQAGRR